jgi:acetoin utilization protein AcuB
MIVRDIMTTKLITVKAEDTLSHAAQILRRYQFHHLPVVQRQGQHRVFLQQTGKPSLEPRLIFQGLVTAQDIETAVALAKRDSEADPSSPDWKDRRVSEIMQPADIWVAPTTSVAAAAQLLVERGIQWLPVIEAEKEDTESCPLLVGLLTRSDLLLALARSEGADQPGTQISIPLPAGHMHPLARALTIADELHVAISHVLVSSEAQTRTCSASLRLSTINPTAFLTRLQQEGILSPAADIFEEGETHA